MIQSSGTHRSRAPATDTPFHKLSGGYGWVSEEWANYRKSRSAQRL